MGAKWQGNTNYCQENWKHNFSIVSIGRPKMIGKYLPNGAPEETISLSVLS